MTPNIQEKYIEIAGQLPGYEARPIQGQMVEAIYGALQSGAHLVVEAGTGAGKSFGYLIPSLLTHQRPLVLSTGTIALQEQLMDKDIPFVAKATGMETLNVKLVKGRRNYICLQKLSEFERTLAPGAPERLYITMLKTSFEADWDGDRATLDFEVPAELWEEILSDSEDCLGRKCAYYRENPYRKAREDMARADILVVNHALYLQDILSGQAVLPKHDVIVFDEAHHLQSYALKAFTARIGKFASNKLLRKIDRRLMPIPEDYRHIIYQTEAAILQWLFSRNKSTFKIMPDETWFNLIDRQVDCLSELRTWLGAVDTQQLTLGKDILEKDRLTLQREKLLNQLDGLITRWAFFQQFDSVDRVNWAEVNADRLYYEIKSTPLNIAEQLARLVWEEKQGILTSATLATGKSSQSLAYFRQNIGLPASQAALPDRILNSPFDFQQQCQLYLPPNMPDPNHPDFSRAVTQQVIQILHHTSGRAFVLFTSTQAMRQTCLAVAPHIAFPCKVQGDLPKHRLIDWFKTTRHSVLFATATFWEGIDIPGEALSCVIIDRIPFATPDEPVHSAMIERIKRLGGDWFNDYVLPQATLRLKQGFGRLIRTRHDLGLVAILDPRLQTKGYGPKILKSLPNTPIITALDARQRLAISSAALSKSG